MAKSKTLGVRKNENVDVLCYRFAALPTNEQIIQLNKTIGCCRYLWNRMLGDHNTLYQEIGVVPNNTPAAKSPGFFKLLIFILCSSLSILDNKCFLSLTVIILHIM